MSETESPTPENAPSEKAPTLVGVKRIADYVKRLPSKPGVYRMMDEHGTVLYVGKAKDLKKRVTAYTKYDRHSTRIRRMISATTQMEFVVCASETEALLLEATLIKRLKPRYNILLRDDKSFPYILVRKDHEAAQVNKHRGARNIKGDYYGPFASAVAVNRTLDTLQRAFRLRNCTDSIYETRTRPCLQYQIKRCSAPCTGEISIQDYDERIQEAEEFLKGKSDSLRKRLTGQMNEAAQHLHYEKAAELRDRIQAMAQVTASSGGLNPMTFSDGDVIGLYTGGGQTCIQVFFFRAGQNWGNSSHFPRHGKDETSGEVLQAFIAQFYSNKPIPKQIFVSESLPNLNLVEDALSAQSGRRIEVLKPERGEKKKLIRHAVNNAHEALARKLAETASQAKLLDELQEIFGLEAPPERIEVYDNSHIQGTNAIGAFIVAGPSGFQKRDYRSFNIKDKETAPGDDYAMMREVFRRRFSRLAKDKSLEWPDLVLIDGGKGQLSVVTETLDELGVLERTTLVAIAKGPDRNAGRETFFMNNSPEFTLPPRTPALYYLQRLRDEAHRFAIGTHRARRKKDIRKNPLDGISGIGPSRKKALLAHFGSAKAVKSASVEEMAHVEGISLKMAHLIHDYFHDR
ncbi:excinuclease ABC subunit C [Litorimonas taeanensis]|uniref:UvrABC system protein C n=1 Tax=Litorimonas taeanensis TaxID=568099 RepID=A0A420WJX7_9PROT|nr:excinuclease ABC subunit UvrC [Litorimonas taeanensis]RKQ71249.1 excinuclease ABC subunit C [Litorimonas taeanensis]